VQELRANTPAGHLRICKYVGFEEARWVIPEVKIPEVGITEAPASPANATETVQA